MKTEAYISYLETVVISLLAERKGNHDIICNDKAADPFFQGFSFSPINIMEEINKERDIR